MAEKTINQLEKEIKDYQMKELAAFAMLAGRISQYEFSLVLRGDHKFENQKVLKK